MRRCKDGIKILYQGGCEGAPTGGVPQTPSEIEPPTAAGQIPVSGLNAAGELKYLPKPDPLARFSSNHVGKAIQINSVGPDGTLFLQATELVEKTGGLKALTTQIGTIDAFGSFTIDNANTITASGGNAIFVENGESEIVNFPASTITIPGANTNTAGRDISYVIANKDKTFTVTETAPTPAQLSSNLYIAEVLHPNGGPIKSARPIATLQSFTLNRIRNIAEALGLVARNVALEYFVPPSRMIRQTSASSELIGYNISNGGNILPIRAEVLTFEYYSYVTTDRIASFSDFGLIYKIDNPAAKTSAAMTAGHFAIIVLGIYRTGEWIAFAPQKEFTTQAEAEAGRTQYLSDFLLPPGYNSFVCKIASAIVPSTNAGIVIGTLKVISNISLIGGSLSSSATVTLQSPASAPNGQIVTVNASTHKYVLSNSVLPNLATAQDGQILVVRSGTLKLETPPTAPGFPTGYNATIKKYFCKIVNAGLSSEGGDTGYLSYSGQYFNGRGANLNFNATGGIDYYLINTVATLLDTNGTTVAIGAVAGGGGSTPQVIIPTDIRNKTVQLTIVFQVL